MNPKIRGFGIQKSKKPRISKIQTSRNIDGPSQNGGLLFKHLFGELSNLTWINLNFLITKDVFASCEPEKERCIKKINSDDDRKNMISFPK